MSVIRREESSTRVTYTFTQAEFKGRLGIEDREGVLAIKHDYEKGDIIVVMRSRETE